MSALVLRVAALVLDVVKASVQCSVETAQISTGADGWLAVVVHDPDFYGTVSVDMLAGALCEAFRGRLTYVGACVSEGGTVTVVISRADDGAAVLRLAAGV